MRFWLGDSPSNQHALERAIAYARRVGNGRLQQEASTCLAATFLLLAHPADTAIVQTKQLLQAANGELWAEAVILLALSVI
jgi:hypothetical protein